MIRYLLLLFFYFGALLAISDPIVVQPTTKEEIENMPAPHQAEEWYELALMQIKAGELHGATESLYKALALDPSLINAKIELGFINLWQNHFERAYEIFVSSLDASPCNASALEGIRTIGLKWAHIQDKQKKEVLIYQTLNQCEPNNPDTLFFLGRSLARTGQWDEAKKVLKQCLNLAPQYSDAEMQLGYIYLWEGKWDQAEAIFLKYPDNTQAKIVLARIARYQGEHAKSKTYLNSVLKTTPHHREARKEQAYLFSAQGNYFEAEDEFSWLIENGEDASNFWPHLYDINTHTHYSTWIETLYTEAKENDPSLKAPVVKDYYFYNAIHLLIPLSNQWRLDLKEIYYTQKENDIYPPIGVNYSAYLAGGQATLNGFFANHYQWDLFARVFHAWGKQDANFPFEAKTRFEPGTSFRYHDDHQLFYLGTNLESFIIKDFSRGISKLLGTINFATAYTYRFNSKLQPEIQATISQVLIRDSLHNWKNTDNLTLQCGFPSIAQYLKGIYFFEYGHFDKLSINYYSFLQQIRNALGVFLHIPLTGFISLDTTYYHRWQKTRDLFQPIGNQVYVASKQILTANWVTTELLFHMKSTLKASVKGHYFRDTLPYRDWGLTSSVFWIF